MDSPRITYAPRRGSTPESERAALGRAWTIVFSAYEEQKKKAAGVTGTDGDEAKGPKHEVRPTGILPR